MPIALRGKNKKHTQGTLNQVHLFFKQIYQQVCQSIQMSVGSLKRLEYSKAFLSSFFRLHFFQYINYCRKGGNSANCKMHYVDWFGKLVRSTVNIFGYFHSVFHHYCKPIFQEKRKIVDLGFRSRMTILHKYPLPLCKGC